MSQEEFFAEPFIRKIWELIPFQNYLILDAGCGEGFWMHPLLQKSCIYIGVDFVKEMITQAKKHAKRCESSKVSLIRCDVRALPFRDDVFDGILSLGVIEHFSETSLTVREFWRTTKDSGMIVISVPNTFDLISKMLRCSHMAHEAVEQMYYTFDSVNKKLYDANIIPQRYEGYDLFGSIGELIIPFIRSLLRIRHPRESQVGRYISTPKWLTSLANHLEHAWFSKYISHMILIWGAVRKENHCA